jgi:hypothetical protein
MGRSLEEQESTGDRPGKGEKRAPPRSLVLVAGSGRSGTSLFTGILQRLGFLVPQPEIPADDTNPRGFAESQWVVDFHTGLLRRARIQVADARPAAWAQTANVGLDGSVQPQLRAWLRKQFRGSDDVVIKDPRLSWFLPVWRRCGEEIGTPPCFVTVLRHPGAVIDSKQRWYGGWHGDVGRAAGWLNQMLFTERATRDAPRVFVRYDDLLDDWTRVVGHVGEALDLAAIRDAPAASMRKVHEFVDRGLSRSRVNWDDIEIPAALHKQIDDVWELMSQLAIDPGLDTQSVTNRFEAARAAYIDLYQDAEAIAQSSILAGQRRAPVHPGVVRLIERVPGRYRRKVPLRWRATVARALHRGDLRDRS